MSKKNTISFWFKGESFNMPIETNHWFELFRLTATNADCCDVGDRLHAIFIRGDYLMLVVEGESAHPD